MAPHQPTHEARDNTDASLLAEREKTDAELTANQAVIGADEDQVVELARERAQQTLGAARELADHDLVASGATNQSEVAHQRAAADAALETERAAADEHLRIERERHARALSALLRLEREATDEGLLVERARADEVIATRDDFLGMVSHDLRDILGTIALGASMLAETRATTGRDVDPATLAIAARIQRGAARMNRLVGDLLDVVALEAGTLHLTRCRQDATQIARDAVEAYQPSFLAKGIALRTHLASGSVVAELDQDRILQVLANLLSNALKFTEPGGHVTLWFSAEDSDVRFSVIDTGIGIPTDKVTAIFERFGQVKRDRRGHGLGLYISKCIVEAHGGTIWVECPESGGTALHFTLPIASHAELRDRSTSAG